MSECIDALTSQRIHAATVMHSKALMMGLNELRLADKLLDVTLLVEGVRLKAHRVVLAACSDYFAAMFTEPMKEATQSEIQLNGVTARGMQILIDFAYTSNLDLDRNNIEETLSAATHIQMNSVVESCSTYLESQIDLGSCVDIASIADLYSLSNLKYKAYAFMCACLEKFSKTEEINNLSCEQLQSILSCDYPVDCSEKKVLMIVLEYCIRNKVGFEWARRLFANIRFDQIKDNELGVDVDIESSYYQTMRAMGLQQKKKDGNANVYDVLSTGVLTNLRGMELALVRIGGFGDDGIHNQLSFALPGERKWHSLTVIPHIKQSNYGAAVLGNDLFIVGGSYDVCLKEYIHGFGFRYCAAKNRWSTIAQLRMERCRFSLNAVGNFLYAVCGVGEFPNSNEEVWAPEGHRISNCERYNQETDSWEYIEPLTENRSQHAGVSHGRYLYISGGLIRHLVLATFWRYDTLKEKWKQARNMLQPRCDHALVAVDDKIYACGGWYEDPVTETRILIDAIDVYDVRTDTWYIETINPVPTFHAGITAVNKKIYFVGGLLSDQTISSSPSVQTYDLVTKEWSTETEWACAKPTWECTCATFYVPRCRDC